MNDESRPARKIEFSIGTFTGIVVMLVAVAAYLGNCTTNHDQDLKKNVTDQLQDDSASARALRAVTWIDNNSWKLNFIGPIKPTK